MKAEILELTKQMVKIPSVNTTDGEREIGVFIENYFRRIPYFQKHPEQVIVQELKDDLIHRRNVFVLLRGERGQNPKTLLLHGHTDTVGVEDYGDLQEYAFDPDKLLQKLLAVELPGEVRKDLLSGEYLFGRGACDMKSGVAVFMVLLKHLSERVEEFTGNLLLSCNPVEENLHTGIIEGIDVIADLKEKYGLQFVLAINNDYTCPMYPGDLKHYIYTGVVGKLLPCFYIQGSETHVGQCFEGYDPTTVAAKLTSFINLNADFCDGYKGEYSLPPVALKMRDLKPWYNVQTAKEAFVYFNYFVHQNSVEEIVEKLMGAAESAVNHSMEEMNGNYKKFCELSKKEFQEISSPWEVMTFEQLWNRASMDERKDEQKKIVEITKEELEKGTDKREIPIEIIRRLLSIANIHHPVVVLYFAAPFCPHNTLKEQDEEIFNKIEKVIHAVEEEENIRYQICRFFPSLSDSSYLAVDDSEASIEYLKKNFPMMDQIYPLPFEKMRFNDMKAVNYGVYGKDAHKWTERVWIPYSFEILPKLILKTITEFLG